MVKGITKRWLLRYLSVTIAFMLFLIFGGSFAVKSYYYGIVKQNLIQAQKEFNSVYSNVMSETKETNDEALSQCVKNFSEKNDIQLSVLNENGDKTLVSDGFEPETDLDMSDFLLY